MAPTDVAAQPGAAQPVTRRINDLSIQVATVNGSGSQTANLVLLRSIFQMGVPVSGKNMFPSNIAGLPTWYTIRANHRRLRRQKEGDRFPRRDECGDGEGRRPLARAWCRCPVRRAAQAEHAPHRPRFLLGALRQAGRRGLPRRKTPASRQEHDLRRGPVEAAEHRSCGDGACAPAAAGQEDQGDRVEPGGPGGGILVCGGAPRQTGSVSGSNG